MNAHQGPLLIVEDIPNILELLEVTLRFKGYEVITARDGQEALEVIKKQRPALVITDILMPKMDGFTFVYRLRSNPETQGIPVVFLSATYIAPEDKDFALTIGATRFLEKPIDNDELLRTITELLAQGSGQPPVPLKERDFLKIYRERLEIKLGQKSAQISRTERLLESLPADQKPGFAATLKQSIIDRESIRAEIDHVRELLKKSDSAYT
ncbi:MAG: response regulator [Chloroflexi bacterium]|nr:response regulator [Chloroflexota bacterium]MBI3339085.1 response regulator [Chloroflexota bacterium]